MNSALQSFCIITLVGVQPELPLYAGIDRRPGQVSLRRKTYGVAKPERRRPTSSGGARKTNSRRV